MCASGAGMPQGGPQVRASRVPTPDEDKEVAHSAFLNAYGQSHHGPNIKGMQEFAGAVSATDNSAGMAGWLWAWLCRLGLQLPPTVFPPSLTCPPPIHPHPTICLPLACPPCSCWRGSASPLGSTATPWATSSQSLTGTRTAA